MDYKKYDASGNDFVIFQSDEKKDFSDLAVKLCDKTNGYDTDGLIVVVPHDKYDFEWMFYNNDGSMANMCGNGSRAVALYAYDNKLCNEKLSFLSGAGKISCTIYEDDVVQTQLTKPIEIKTQFDKYGYTWWLVDTGVRHLVTLVDDLNKFDLDICAKMRKEYDANVNFAQIKEKKLYVRTFEKGVEDETLACGTGMAACFLYGYNQNLLSSTTKTYPKSNEELMLSYKNETLYFKGKVKRIQ